jgi:hypothetical protein
MVIGEGAGRGGSKPRRDARADAPRGNGEQRNAARGNGAPQRADRARSDAAPRRGGNRGNGHARLLAPKR